MTHEHQQLIERTRRLLQERELPCAIAGAATDDEIEAAEQALGCTLAPSYKQFLRSVGGMTLPHSVSTIHCLVGLKPSNGEGTGLVERTLTARTEHRLTENLVIVALGSQPGEWFCLDIDRVNADGEGAVFLFDARDNQLDQQFYDDYGSMLSEVLAFVVENLEDGSDVAPGERSEETSAYGP